MCCRAISSRTNARPLARSAPPRPRWARPWSRPKGPAPPTTAMAVLPRSRRNMPEPIDFANWSCPLPLRHHPNIVMGHGGGGKLSGDLIQHLFVPAFANATLAGLGDAAALDLPGGRLAFSTDSFVVR